MYFKHLWEKESVIYSKLFNLLISHMIFSDLSYDELCDRKSLLAWDSESAKR